MNKVTLLGRLGADPEFKTLESGANLCTFSLATSERWKDNAGNKQERTDWHRCVAWAKTAETITHYFSKGDQILIEGRLNYEQWTDKDGNKRTTAKVTVSQFHFVGGAANTTESATGATNQAEPAPVAAGEDDEDLPF